MQIHRFTYDRTAAPAEPLAMNEKTFRQAYPGEFLDFVPSGYSPCRASYRPYQCASGEVVGVKFHQPSLRDPT